ncbi:hypothetical protein [Streptomyces sp. NPDC102462]|uniref:hypothetical protein n=1 Tax=Streptomyces sp. NPDC102462 TaxID=3366178 RepID=UPI0037F2EC97
MNTAEPNGADRHPHVRHLLERAAEHHHRVQAEREEAALENTIDAAAFDLAADIAHPTAGQTEPGYDIEADLGTQPRH